MVGPRGVPILAMRRGRKPRVPLTQVLPTLTFHVMQDAGTLAEHLFQLFRTPLADSSWSDRRQRLPWEIFAELMRRALRPRATPRQHREAFWRGWRLVGLDGTQFSLINTPQVTATVEKAATRRGRAAFAKLTTAVLLEIGLHNPVAAAVGRKGESEWALGQRLLAQLPARALLLGDRLYGVTAFARQAQVACARVGSHFLLRASRAVKPRVSKRLPDGSRLVRLAIRAARSHGQIVDWLECARFASASGGTASAPTSCDCGRRCSIRGRRPRSSWRGFTRAAGTTSCTFAKSNGSCAGPQSCRVTPWKPARKRSPRSCWPVPSSPANVRGPRRATSPPFG
jgi:hypothetical protein